MKSLYQKKAKNRKGNSAYLPDNEVCLKNKNNWFHKRVRWEGSGCRPEVRRILKEQRLCGL